MNWLQLLHKRRVQAALCVILTVALSVGMVAPGTMLSTVQPENPLAHAQLHEIEPLLLGQEEEGQSGQSGANSQTESSEADPQEQTGVDTQETTPQETKPEQSQPEEPGTGDGEEGQEDGNDGEEGGELIQPDLSVVLTWYKYGTQPKTVVCGPSDTVAKTINTAQLRNNELKYAFSAVGKDAHKLQITAVTLKEGDSAEREVDTGGRLTIQLPDAQTSREYTFRVDAQLKTKDEQGKTVRQNVSFTYVLRCRYALDLELELAWEKQNGTSSTISCAANQSAARTVQSSDLAENVLVYTPKLTGTLAESAQITKADYRTASGANGVLEKDGGSLILQAANGADREAYYLTFEAKLEDEDGESMTVFFHYTILFIQTMDVKLSFTWLERGSIPRQLICLPNGSVSEMVKINQLSAGAVKYEMALTGEDGENARILDVSYTSEAAGGGVLETSGALPMTLPEGVATNTYTIRATVLVGSQQLFYEIRLKHTMDVALQMYYTVCENGTATERSVLCENGKTKTAEAVYDDQLPDGQLQYTMAVAGADISQVSITSVTCYQSGNGTTRSLCQSDGIKLLLKNGKTGENTFAVAARDTDGTEYTFKINIPYKHRGENIVKISTNLTDGQVVTNETDTNLSVNAWTEDAAGDIVDAIPANGTDTKLIVQLDGQTLSYVSSSGMASEYVLHPDNPETGDTNEHILRIYAEDSYGNYGELTLTLRGQRNQAGQKKGNATIYVDMTTLGMGVVDSVTYEVLADEPMSYSVAKAVLGMDTGDPFGAAAQTLGWSGRYIGTLDTGFYLQSLTPGRSANSLSGSRWNQYGSSEEEILRAIDAKFGKGTGLATLWRCIYRNGLNKSGGSGGSYGEFDYTSGSGWVFCVNGSYYPGQSMSSYYLEDGDVLTLRYTLAYGWDVGSGTAGYGNTVGYCVTAVNGNYSISHRMEAVQTGGGEVVYRCRCCGLQEDCAHKHTDYKDLDDGTHVKYCKDCDTIIGDPEDHRWQDGENDHNCKDCGAREEHIWKEVAGSNTATCTEPGVRIVRCVYCKATRQEDTSAAGHKLDNRWNHTKRDHYQKCSVCQTVMEESRGQHRYKYDAFDEDWYCEVCEAGHDWDYCGNEDLKIRSATCRKIVYICEECDIELPIEGSFPAHHEYKNGACIHCGGKDPDYVPPETEPKPTEPQPTEPKPTEPQPTEPNLRNRSLRNRNLRNRSLRNRSLRNRSLRSQSLQTLNLLRTRQKVPKYKSLILDILEECE